MCNTGKCQYEKKSGPNRGDCVIIEFPAGWICPDEIEILKQTNNQGRKNHEKPNETSRISKKYHQKQPCQQ